MTTDVVVEPVAVDIDGASFLQYLDPDAELVIGCFALGTGVAEPQLASLGRQVAEELASIFQLLPGFVTVPQMLLARVGEQEHATTRIRSAFAVFHSLPETQILKQASRAIGASLAVTGRLIGEGPELHLGINVVDVERGYLLAVAHEKVVREEMVEALARVATHLLAKFGRADPDTLQTVETLIGTRSYRAFYNWAHANDLDRERRAGVGPGDLRRLTERLGYAMVDDPRYDKPVGRMVEILAETQDESVLGQLARSLVHVPLVHPTVGLVRAEVLLRLGERDEARNVLQAVIDKHPGCAQAFFLLGELESGVRPAAATNYYRQAHLLAPHRALYKQRLHES